MYCVLVVLCGTTFMQLSAIACFALPFSKHVEGGTLMPVLAVLFGWSLIILMILSMLAALLLPLLAGRIIAYVVATFPTVCLLHISPLLMQIGLFLMLGGGRFKRKTINFFVTGYRNRFDARRKLSLFIMHTYIYCYMPLAEVFFIVTLAASLVICFVVAMNLPLLQWLPKFS